MLELQSDLGGGKTTFVRGLAAGLGSTDHVASPTFTISRQYNAADLTLMHYDFYRLTDAGIIAAELAEAINNPKVIIAVEWADVVAQVLPIERVSLKISVVNEDIRRLQFEYTERFDYVFEGEV